MIDIYLGKMADNFADFNQCNGFDEMCMIKNIVQTLSSFDKLAHTKFTRSHLRPWIKCNPTVQNDKMFEFFFH